LVDALTELPACAVDGRGPHLGAQGFPSCPDATRQPRLRTIFEQERAMGLGPVSASPTIPPPAAPAMDLPNAVRILNRDFGAFDVAGKHDGEDGIVSRHNLEAVRDDPGRYTEEQREAARYVLDHDDAYAALDTAAQHDGRDGDISRKDLTDFAVQHPDALPSLGARTVSGSDTETTSVHIDAQASDGAAWGNDDGPRAGIVSVYVDGRYVADATILAENPEGVDVALGVLGAGDHTIELRDSSAIGTGVPDAAVRDVEFSATTAAPAAGGAAAPPALVDRYAPVVHYADNEQAGDNTPLLTSARTTDNGDGTTTIRYSILYTNEDGGDGEDPARLAGKWGRTTDDESVYSVTVDNRSGELVGFDSKSLGSAERGDPSWGAFMARWNANATNGRPQLAVVNGHNQYGWASDHDYRAQNRAYAGQPIIADGRTTIGVMNDHPWTWHVATEEMRREGKMDAAQPYQRVYLDLQQGDATFRDVSRISVHLTDGRTITIGEYHAGGLFNRGDNRLNASDNVSVTLPADISPDQVASVEIEGLPGDAVVQAQYLGSDDRPVPIDVG
jgi:hypothetical protein